MSISASLRRALSALRSVEDIAAIIADAGKSLEGAFNSEHRLCYLRCTWQGLKRKSYVQMWASATPSWLSVIDTSSTSSRRVRS
jgi:hypothetical protein